MPNSIVTHLIERVAKLEERVKSLLLYQKWSMGLLSAVFLLVLGALVKGK